MTATYPSTRTGPTSSPSSQPVGGPSRQRPARTDSVLPQGALVLLSLASAVSLGRLFTNSAAFVAPVGFAILAVHGACWLCRRKGLGLGVATVAAGVALVVAIGWTTLPQSTSVGIPGPGTLAAIGRALSAAMDRFHSVSPPTKVVPGFVVAGALGCASAAFLADWAAFRMRATIEACLPSFSLFVFSAALARGHGTSMAVAVWIGALLCFLLVREAGVDTAPAAWFASRSDRGPAAVLQLGGVLIVATVALAVVLGPLLPGATTKPVVNWRRPSGGAGGRMTTSPLVDIRSRINEQSSVEVFTVKSKDPHYWRITALSHFDGNGWSLADNYVTQRGKLPGAPTAGPALLPFSAEFSISNLESIWLPAPYRPVYVNIPAGYSEEAASLLANRPPTSDGLQYRVDAVSASPDLAALQKSAPVSDPALAPYLTLPADLRLDLKRFEIDAARAATTPYEKALALQTWFHDGHFIYDTSVPADDSAHAMRDFLTGGRGFCQQFAGTYAAMARDMGLPARVAVGFTPGVLEGDTYHVQNLHAHAWPEVYFDKIGWLAFEPTPARGDPSATGYTHVPPAQSGPIDPRLPITTPQSTLSPAPNGPTPSLKPRQLPGGGGLSSNGATHHRGLPGTVWAVAAGVLVAAVASTPLLTLWRRVRRRMGAKSAGAQVLLAWEESRERLAVVGAPARGSDTPAEYARRASRGAALSEPEARSLNRLAGAVEHASYAGGRVSEEVAAVAVADRDVVSAAAASRQSLGQRLLGVFDPRRLRR